MAKIMWQLLAQINKQLVIAIPVMMTLGFLCGTILEETLIIRLKNLIIPFTFLMVYPMMVTLNFNHLLAGIRNVRLQVVTQAVNFALIPFLAYGLGLVFFREQPYMALGLLLASLLPTSGMTISWTGFAKGNIGAAINMTIIGLSLGAIVAPLYVQGLMGSRIDTDILLIVTQIFLIVFLPMSLGFTTRQYLLSKYSKEEFQQNIAPRLPGLSTIGVLGIVFVALALKAKAISGSPQLLGSILVPLLILYGVNFVLSTVIGKMFFSRGDAVALVYGTAMRNLSIALAIAINAFGQAGADAALVIAVAYVIQVQSAAWYVRFTDTVFGVPATTVLARPDLAPPAPQKNP
jgi:ACR3 family arsenite efflux pump ArsB